MNYTVKNLDGLHAVLDEFCEYLRAAEISEESIFDSRLALSELTTNVLRHTKEEAVIDGGIVNGKIEAEVFSATAFVPPENISLPAPDAECGRGLFLVRAVVEDLRPTERGGLRIVIRTTYAVKKKE